MSAVVVPQQRFRSDGVMFRSGAEMEQTLLDLHLGAKMCCFNSGMPHMGGPMGPYPMKIRIKLAGKEEDRVGRKKNVHIA
jgi:hypothetical protein